MGIQRANRTLPKDIGYFAYPYTQKRLNVYLSHFHSMHLSSLNRLIYAAEYDNHDKAIELHEIRIATPPLRKKYFESYAKFLEKIVEKEKAKFYPKKAEVYK